MTRSKASEYALDPLEPWKRQERESDAAWNAWNVYLSLGPGRSFEAVAEKISATNYETPESKLKRVRNYSERFFWLARAAATEKARAATLAQIVETGVVPEPTKGGIISDKETHKEFVDGALSAMAQLVEDYLNTPGRQISNMKELNETLTTMRQLAKQQGYEEPKVSVTVNVDVEVERLAAQYGVPLTQARLLYDSKCKGLIDA